MTDGPYLPSDQPAGPPAGVQPYAAPYGQQAPAPSGQQPLPYASPYSAQYPPVQSAPLGQVGGPSLAAPATGVASFGLRAAAYLLDSGTIAVSFIPLALFSGILSAIHLGFLGGLLTVAWWLAVIAYMPYFEGTYGQTIGKRLVHIRVADQATGGPIDLGRAVVRYLVLGVSCIPFDIGLFSPLFDSSGRMQGWHDKAANSVVVTGDATNWPTLLAFLKAA